MVTFDKAYCEEQYPNVKHPHHIRRAEWILKHFSDKDVVIVGAGYGHILDYLPNAIGVEKSEYMFQESGRRSDMINISAAEYEFCNKEVVFSWNMLDALSGKVEARKVCRAMEYASDQYHILCIDDKSKQARSYRADGFFIQPIEYWLELLPEAKLIEYHSGIVHNTDSLQIPLSWKFISK